MKNWKKKLWITLAVCAVFSIYCCIISLAVDVVDAGECGERATWVLTDDGVLKISGDGDMYDFDYYSEDDSDSPWYLYRDRITDVKIYDGITRIGNASFANCSFMKTVSIPESIVSIGMRAFEDCSSIEDILIPNSVTSIGLAAFMSCTALKEIEISDNIDEIGDSAFAYCSSLGKILVDNDNPNYSNDSYGILYNKEQTEIIKVPCKYSGDFKISDNVSFIYQNAFYDCSDITRIIVGNENANYYSDDRGVLFDKEKTNLIRAPGKLTGEYKIPDGVKGIATYAFAGCSEITNVIIPESVNLIGTSAFERCTSLEVITIPNGVMEIYPGVFGGCTSLTEIAIPKSVSDIDFFAFYECQSLRTVYYAGSAEQWEDINIVNAYNDPLFNAEVIFNSPVLQAPKEGVAEIEEKNSALMEKDEALSAGDEIDSEANYEDGINQADNTSSNTSENEKRCVSNVIIILIVAIICLSVLVLFLTYRIKK